MAESAIVARVLEAEPFVASLRERFDPTARLGMPAHVTVLYPFIGPGEITDATLARAREVAASFDRFSFRLARIGTFPDTIYLTPDPAAPLVALTEAFVRAFPDFPPYGGRHAAIVPHLTVAHASGAEQAAIVAQLHDTLPQPNGITVTCRDLVLYESASGRWRERSLLPLAVPPPTIATARLRLRRPTLADAGAIFSYASDPEVTRFMDWPAHRSVETVGRFLQECLARLDDRSEIAWAITEPPDDRAIGMIACRVKGAVADFGYVLARRHWGRGLATEAATAVVAWAESLGHLERIWASCDVENAASARVLERAGLVRERVLPGAVVRPNIAPEPRDALVYGRSVNAARDRDKPAHLRAAYGAQFADECIARAYHTRPPYPAEVFDVLARLLPHGGARVLDLGCGTGDLALGLVGRATHIDAVDPSAAMLRVARARPGADDPTLRWICAAAETFALDARYGLVVAGESFHWMDWDVVCARLARALHDDGVVALIQRRGLHDVPWAAELAQLVPRHSTNRDYRPYDVVDELTRRGLFTVRGRRAVTAVPFQQSVDDYVESFHTRNGFSRARMTDESAAQFDRELRRLVARHASDGLVRGEVGATVVWGTVQASAGESGGRA